MLHDLALPVRLTTRSGEVTLRNATDADLDALMTLLSDDPISAARGDVAAPADRPQYAEALRSIVDDPANALLVAEDVDGQLVVAPPDCSSRRCGSAVLCAPAASGAP